MSRKVTDGSRPTVPGPRQQALHHTKGRNLIASFEPEIVCEVLDVAVGLDPDGMTMDVFTHDTAFAHVVADRVVAIAPLRSFSTASKSERARRFFNQLVF